MPGELSRYALSFLALYFALFRGPVWADDYTAV